MSGEDANDLDVQGPILYPTIMSNRHWLRDEIDFGYFDEDHPHEDILNRCSDGDACHVCNRAAQEIADSLALYNMPCSDLADYLASDPGRLEVMARRECSGFYWYG